MEKKYNRSPNIQIYQIVACIFALFLSISTSEAIKKDEDWTIFDLFNRCNQITATQILPTAKESLKEYENSRAF